MFVLEHFILEHATIDGLPTRSITCVRCVCGGWVCVGVCVCGGGMKHKDCPNVFGETSEDV